MKEIAKTTIKPITNDTEVALIIVPGKIEWQGPFADFCASNKFEDGEIAQMERCLNRRGSFIGGIGGGGSYELHRSQRIRGLK